MLSGYFVTGSDTAVGKTWISCQLITQLKKCHSSVKVRKPIESGCEYSSDNQLIAADGEKLFLANGRHERPDIITPYRFHAALAPDRAAKLENCEVTLLQLQQAVSFHTNEHDLLLVEGAGGYLSPICSNGLNADLAETLGLSIIIVIEDRLGAINQALLTISAVEKSQLPIHAIILNRINAEQKKAMDNQADLKQHIEYPVYSCPYQGSLEQNIFC